MPRRITMGIRKYTDVRMVYLLHSNDKKPNAEYVQKLLQDFGIEQVILKEIDPFSFEYISYIIIDISKKHSNLKEDRLFVNIGGGTAIMIAAAMTASIICGAQAYYIKHNKNLSNSHKDQDQLLELPSLKMSFTSLEDTQIKIIKLLSEKKEEKIFSKRIVDELDISPQNTSYHLKELSKKKLVNMVNDERDSRSKPLSLTDAGKFMSSLI